MPVCKDAACACRVVPRHPRYGHTLPIGTPLFHVPIPVMVRGAMVPAGVTVRVLERLRGQPILGGNGIVMYDGREIPIAALFFPMCSGGTDAHIEIERTVRTSQTSPASPAQLIVEDGVMMTQEFATLVRKQAVDRRVVLTDGERTFLLCFLMCMQRCALLPAIPPELQLIILGLLNLGDLSPALPAVEE